MSGNPKSTLNRPGYTLVEMMAVIALSSVVLGLIGVLLHGVWLVKRGMDDHSWALDSINRLAQQFRDDTHAAESAKILDGPASQTLIMTQANRVRVEYQADGDAIERIVKTNDQATQRETYRLPPDASVRCEIQPLAEYQQASVTIAYPLATQSTEFADRRQLHIEAIVGLCPQEIRLNGNNP